MIEQFEQFIKERQYISKVSPRTSNGTEGPSHGIVGEKSPSRSKRIATEGLNRSSEFLPVMHTAVHNLVAQGLVRTLGSLIIDEGIGSHLAATVNARPVLRLGQQPPAYTALAVILGNVPALDVSHRS